jgi:hypothetical protein
MNIGILKILDFQARAKRRRDELWYYLLVAILKKELKIDQSLYEILQVLSVNIFERTQVNQLFAEFDYKSCEEKDRQPLLL